MNILFFIAFISKSKIVLIYDHHCCRSALISTKSSRESINARMRSELDVATDPWGIKVNRVELKNIIPPRDIQEAMEKNHTPWGVPPVG